jgi:glycine cleavage system H protein
VVAVNPQLAKQPELVNREPYQGGWFFKLKLTQPSEADRLLDAESYARQIAP